MGFNIPYTDKKRVVIIGGGFGGLKLAEKLKKSKFQGVLPYVPEESGTSTPSGLLLRTLVYLIA